MAQIEIEAKGVKARIDLQFGMISGFTVERDGREVSMLHTVPWLGEKMPDDAAPHLGGLAGDFFCAPLRRPRRRMAHRAMAGRPIRAGRILAPSGRATPPSRASAWTARRWARTSSRSCASSMAPLPSTQRHIFTGGHADNMSVANHAMVSLPNGGQLSFSPKRWWETPQIPLEPDPARGRSLLACPVKVEQPRPLPARRRRRGRHHQLSFRLASRGFRHRCRGGR